VNISDEQLARFKQMYTAQFCRELSDEEAYDKLIKLLRLLTIMAKYSPKRE
jgi:hypothetical protein